MHKSNVFALNARAVRRVSLPARSRLQFSSSLLIHFDDAIMRFPMVVPFLGPPGVKLLIAFVVWTKLPGVVDRFQGFVQFAEIVEAFSPLNEERRQFLIRRQ